MGIEKTEYATNAHNDKNRYESISFLFTLKLDHISITNMIAIQFPTRPIAVSVRILFFICVNKDNNKI